jgi:hypothetical protein
MKNFSLVLISLLFVNLVFSQNVKTREEAISLVEKDCFAFESLDEKYRTDKEIVLLAVQNCEDALKFASQDLKKDKELVLKAIKIDERVLEFADESLKKDKEVVLMAVYNDPRTLKFADKSLQDDRAFILEILDKKYSWNKSRYISERRRQRGISIDEGYILLYLNKNLKRDKEIILKAVKGNALEIIDVDQDLLDDDVFVKEILTQNGSAFEFLNKKQRGNENLALSAVLKTPDAIQFVTNKLWNNRDFVLKAVKQNASTLVYIKESYRKDREIVLAAVNNPEIVNTTRYESKAKREDKEIGRTVPLRGKPTYIYYVSAFEFIDQSLRNDREIVTIAVKKKGNLLKFASESMKKDKEVVLAAIKNSVSALEYADLSLRKDKDFMIEAIHISREAFKYIDASISGDEEIKKELEK